MAYVLEDVFLFKLSSIITWALQCSTGLYLVSNLWQYLDTRKGSLSTAHLVSGLAMFYENCTLKEIVYPMEVFKLLIFSYEWVL